ncbi:MAG TPA: hypothetical protein VM425_07705 [Myxococcota bacterium]|nr:hypothetical protein [Myxococcota bacterium]
MLNAGIIANVLVAFVFGLAAGIAWFYSGLNREAGSHFGKCLKGFAADLI